MKLVTYRLADFEGSEMTAFGALHGDDVVRLDVAPGHDYSGLGSVEDYLAGLPGTHERAKAIVADASAPRVPLAAVHTLPALPHPVTVLACRPAPEGLHTDPVVDPIVSGPGRVIAKGEEAVSRYGIRPQLGIVTPKEMALPLEHIAPAAYVIFNEIHVHDIETGHQRVGVGLGPYLVTPDEVRDPLALEIRVTFRDRDPWHGVTAYEHGPHEILFELQRRYHFRAGTLIGLGPIPGSFGLDGD